MTKRRMPALPATLKACAATFVAFQLMTGCSIAPKPVEAKVVLSKALASTNQQPVPLVKTGEYVLSETEHYRIQPPDPTDPYHKNGMRPEMSRILMWQSGGNSDTYKMQRVNPTSNDVLWESTQSVVNGQVYRQVRDTVSAVEFTTVVPPSSQTAQNSDTKAAEALRRNKLLEGLGQNATASRLQSTDTGRPIFRVISRLPFDQGLIDANVLNLLDQQPKELKLTYDIDEETYEIVGQSTVAVLPNGSERVVESTRLVSRTTGPLSDLPRDWFTIKDTNNSVHTYGFDIHQEVSAGRATEEIKILPEGRVLSIISGSASELVKGLQSAAPVWSQSKEVTLTLAGSQQQAWLCEGGVLASDPVRRLLIFTSGDRLFYVTGQAFDTSDEFVQAASAELGR